MKRLLFIFLSLFIGDLPAAVYSVEACGAVGDGKTVNTAAIQKTIDQCRDHGGGTVLITTGVYISGALQLYSNTHLRLEAGAVLKGSPDLQDYNLKGQVVGLLYCRDAEDVTIGGPGTIDGNGDVFFEWDRAKKIENASTAYTRQMDKFREVTVGIGDGPVLPKPRPYQMIIFSNCRNVSVRDVLITNSPFWSLHFADCDGIIVSGIRIRNNLLVPNGDGLDLTSCSNVLVSDCDIRAGDDAIAITGYDHHFDLPGYQFIKHDSKNITITNCSLLSRSSGIRIGGLDQNSMRNYVFNNIVIYDSNRGIGLFVRDAGSIENMIFTNIIINTRLFSGDWWGNGEPIHLSAVRLTENVNLGCLKNIKFSHVLAEGESGILIYGTTERSIENVSFEDITLRIKDNPRNLNYGGNFDLRPVRDSRLQLFEHDIPAVFAQYVKNLRFNNFELSWDAVNAPFFTHGMEIDHFEDVFVGDFKGSPSPTGTNLAAIKLTNGQGYRLENCRTTGKGMRLLQTENISEP